MLLRIVFALTAVFSTQVIDSHQQSQFPTASGSVQFVNEEWVGEIQCNFYNSSDCNVSVPANGARIEGPGVTINCDTPDPTLELQIHAFTFADVNIYTCLQDTQILYVDRWLNATPVMEVSGIVSVGQPMSLRCNAPPGSRIYWSLSGSASTHETAVITDTSNAQNSSSTLTFTLQNSDQFASYKCCISSDSQQPPSNLCSTYTVAFPQSSDIIEVNEDYSTEQFYLTVKILSNPVTDPSTVIWRECTELGVCSDISPIHYNASGDPLTYALVSHLDILENVNVSYYSFTAQTADGSSTKYANCTVKRGFYSPVITQHHTQAFLTEENGNYTVQLKFTIRANPQPNITWTKQMANEDCLGSVPVTTDGHYLVSTKELSASEWEASLALTPFDLSRDDAIFTLTAQNVNGESRFAADPSVGPTSLSMTEPTANNGSFEFKMAFGSFPLQHYFINVVSPYVNTWSVDQVFDRKRSLYFFNVSGDYDSIDTFLICSCGVYNPYDPNNLQLFQIYLNVTGNV